MKRNFFLISFLLVSLSCAPRYNAVVNFRGAGFRQVIVLPFENQTTDMRAQQLLRKKIYTRFFRHGYLPLPLKTVDGKLKEIGITDGGQLRAVNLKELKKLFGEGALFYGTVEEFTFQNLGFIIRKKVKLSVKMVDLSNFETVYENTAQKKDTKIYTSKEEAKKAFIRASAVKLLSNMLNSPMVRLSEIVVRRIFDKIPRK